jgi:hypothetical protein
VNVNSVESKFFFRRMMWLAATAPAQILSPSTGCTWRDPSSRRVYDLSSFAGREVSVAETLNGVDVQLFASICGNSQHKCKGASYPVVLLALGDCFSGGELTSQELTATKNGLSIAYSGGSECDALGGTASARAELECDPHEPGRPRTGSSAVRSAQDSRHRARGTKRSR